MSTPLPTTAWSDLSVSEAVQYGIPFIDPNTFQPTIDAANFAFKQGSGVNLTGAEYLGNSGDLTGTDILNLGAQGDSYIPSTLQDVNTVGKTPGWTISTSRGTRALPSIVQTGDYVGEFGAYTYSQLNVNATATYYKVAGLTHYVSGADAYYPGGELRIGTKQNAGAFTEWLKLTNTGTLSPLTQSTVGLGLANLGFTRFTLDYTNSATIGAVTINKPCGSGNIAAGASSCVVTNSLVTSNSLVLAWLMANDGTLTSIKSIIPANGSFTVAGNANATANCKFGFLVINTDS